MNYKIKLRPMATQEILKIQEKTKFKINRRRPKITYFLFLSRFDFFLKFLVFFANLISFSFRILLCDENIDKNGRTGWGTYPDM